MVTVPLGPPDMKVRAALRYRLSSWVPRNSGMFAGSAVGPVILPFLLIFTSQDVGAVVPVG